MANDANARAAEIERVKEAAERASRRMNRQLVLKSSSTLEDIRRSEASVQGGHADELTPKRHRA